MAWTPLAERFAALPLILAGPIVRRVEPESATVWLALKEPRLVTLRIYTRDDAGALVPCIEGTRRTVRLGDHLHVVAVTARPGLQDEKLAWGASYYYDVFFTPPDSSASETGSADHLLTHGVLVDDPAAVGSLELLRYPGQPLPGFVLPPTDLNHVRVVHGSCRKPHGEGREALSALDTLLETAIRQGEERPQQLFLTGDQIYADDVAAPLLYALIDAGTFLFSGNVEERLPLSDLPARSFPPSSRSDLVRNHAAFTTTTPQNHLLALSEFASMYLFAWSDTLWPDDLPAGEECWRDSPATPSRDRDAEHYDETLVHLYRFCDTLPQVRRALANIATYMICDDHEVTDDWYLDGAWCQRVVVNPLSRRIIRNALLAYAIFQAWGNTPEQFASMQGAALLDALDGWRGEEQGACVAIVEDAVGMPLGLEDGELRLPQQALRWYYSYAAAYYQVIVLDTRNWRLYHTPGDFPGLLSPAAIQAQLAANVREEVDVSIIISATPVIGVDFVENVQFWSHWRIKDNYSYDREAWALEWDTFQRLLKTVSAMQRVVFLAGDVHYAFGASMEYWDLHTQKTARLINFTSSPLCNEGSGSQIAVLAIGYPRLLRVLRRQAGSIAYFAWDVIPGNHHLLTNYIRTLIYKRLYQFWWSLPRMIAASRSPYEVVLPATGWDKGAFTGLPPDRTYGVSYLRNTLYPVPAGKAVPQVSARERLAPFSLKPVHLALGLLSLAAGAVRLIRQALLRRHRHPGQLQGQTRNLISYPVQALRHRAAHRADQLEHELERRKNRLVGILFNYEGLLRRWKAGAMIVGYNNLGDISFRWTVGQKDVVQRLWWYRPDSKAPMLLCTDYRESLELPAASSEPPLP
jgi:hypothetical protein